MKPFIINDIEVFVDEVEKYIQVNDISEKDLARLWEYLQMHCHGYELVLCFRDAAAPVDTLAVIGAEVLEDCLTMKATQNEFIPYPCNDMTPLEKSDFAEFSVLHDKVNPECGGTSQRILSKWDNWRVFLLRKKSSNEIIGYSIIHVNLRDAAMGEIFCVWASSSTHRKAMLSAATQCAFQNGKEVIVYMVDRDNANEYEAALAVGYQEAGYYVGYRVDIRPI